MNCKGCVYWRPLAANVFWACNYLLDEGHSRQGTRNYCDKRREGDVELYLERKRKDLQRPLRVVWLRGWGNSVSEEADRGERADGN